MAAAEHDYVLYQRGEEGESDAWDDSVLIKAYDNAVSAMKARLAEQHPEYSSSQPGAKAKKKRNKSKPKKKKKSHQDTGVKWSPGDLCRAVYTEDGEMYEARILSMDEERDSCRVQYIGYGNEEEQLLSSLLPLESAGSSQGHKTDTASESESVGRVSAAQEIKGQSEKTRHNKPSSSSHHQPTRSKAQDARGTRNMYPPPPPPPPPPSIHMTQPSQPFPPFQYPSFPGYHAAGPSAPIPPTFPCVPPPPPPPMFTEGDSGEENEALYSMLISWYMSGYHTGYYQGLKQSAASASAAAGHGGRR